MDCCLDRLSEVESAFSSWATLIFLVRWHENSILAQPNTANSLKRTSTSDNKYATTNSNGWLSIDSTFGSQNGLLVLAKRVFLVLLLALVWSLFSVGPNTSISLKITSAGNQKYATNDCYGELLFWSTLASRMGHLVMAMVGSTSCPKNKRKSMLANKIGLKRMMNRLRSTILLATPSDMEEYRSRVTL